MVTKEQLLDEFSGCLFDFWGEEPTRTRIKEAWSDFLDTVREGDKTIPKSYYKLDKLERERLYREAGLL